MRALRDPTRLSASPLSLVLALVLGLASIGCEEERARGGQSDARVTDAAQADDAGRSDAADPRDAGDPADGAAPLDSGAMDAGREDAGPEDAGGDDAGALDTGVADAGPPDTGPTDSGTPDAVVVDAGPPDTGVPDTGPPDLGFPDAGFPDAGFPDTGVVDAGPPDAGTVACANGGGRVLWRLTFPANQGGYARIEEWQNGCQYSVGNQACSLSGEPNDYANWGPGIVLNSTRDFLRVRFSVAGIPSFTSATLYLAAHADGSGIPNAVLESPLYGSLSFAPTVPISQHRTYVVDWSNFLSPSDQPSLTAVTLRSMPTGFAVSEMELCVN